MGKKKLTVIHLEKIDPELRNHFKAICARKGVTMRDELIRLIEREVEKDAKGKS